MFVAFVLTSGVGVVDVFGVDCVGVDGVSVIRIRGVYVKRGGIIVGVALV